MNCSQYEEMIEAFMDDELNDLEAAKLKKHMDACSKCYSYFIEAEELNELLNDKKEYAIPDDFERRIMKRVCYSRKSDIPVRIKVFVLAALFFVISPMVMLLFFISPLRRGVGLFIYELASEALFNALNSLVGANEWVLDSFLYLVNSLNSILTGYAFVSIAVFIVCFIALLSFVLWGRFKTGVKM